MLSLPRFKTKPFVGLDIHSEEIRLLQLKEIKKTICLEKIATQPLATGLIAEGKIKDTKAVTHAIQHVAKQTETQGYPAAIALPNNSVITKRIKLPIILTEAECENEILTHVERYFPGMNEPLCIDFVILENSNAEYHDIFLVAARAEQLKDYVNSASAGYDVKIVDVDSRALARALYSIKIAPPLQSVLDINSSSAKWLVFQNQEMIFSQVMHANSVADLVSQLSQARQMFCTMHPQLSLTTIILTGNLSCFYPEDDTLPVDEWIYKECGLIVAANQFFSGIKIAPTIDIEKLSFCASRFWVSFGLALRGHRRD